jgi:hypothetical protein
MTQITGARRFVGGLVALALAAGCASSGPRTIPKDLVNYQGALPMMRVPCGDKVPADAYAASVYRGRWFWIDDRDIASNPVFAFLTLLFSLAEAGGNPNLPVLTIPTG